MRRIGLLLGFLAATVWSAQTAEARPARHAHPAGPRSEVQAALGRWHDRNLDPDARANALIAVMTREEKLQLLHGSFGSALGGRQVPPGSRGGEGFVPGIPRLDIPDLQLIDGALGVTNLGHRADGAAVAMPSTLAVAASFDAGLAYEMGAAVGRETREQGFDVLLGGGVNVQREALDGRAFEYLGEDPLLAGELVAQQLKAVQDQGVIATVKHFALNTQETDRFGVNEIVDERSLREVDLLPFELAVKGSQAGAVMCAYNKVNGVYACENGALLGDVLKQEWQFPGWVMSDWGATHSTVAAANAGLDQEFFANQYFSAKLGAAVDAGQVSPARLDDMVRRILRSIAVAGLDRPPSRSPMDVEADLATAQHVEARGIVLLQNDGGVLPLSKSIGKIAIIGAHADIGVLSGGGSSQVDPIGGKHVDGDPNDPRAIFLSPVWDLSSPLRAIAAKAPGAAITFASGDDVGEAVRIAKEADVAIVFAYQHRREGADLADLSLPGGQDALIRQVAGAARETIVVLETGGAVLTPWRRDVAGIVEAWYPGNRGADAIADVLFGDVNPSGKLPLTFPQSEADLPRPSIVGFPDPPDMRTLMMSPRALDVPLSEGLAVGYKWFDAQDKTPAFPFGFGLSYTRFAYTNLRASAANGVSVTFDVKNAGDRPGREISQIYVGFPQSAGEPPRRLAGWTLSDLAPGEEKHVTLTLDPMALSIWDVGAHAWRIPEGTYRIFVGSSSRDAELRTDLEIGAAR